MAVLDSAEIVIAGVKHLENWLKENGYTSIAIDIWQPGSADIQANGKEDSILVQVRTVCQSTEKIPINGTDKFALEERAKRLCQVPYVAYITIDNNNNLVGEIIWERLGLPIGE